VEGDPVTAFQESARVLRQGGYLVHTTCFFNEIHQKPHDYWRFTPMALRLLCDLAGVTPLQVAGWGNLFAWRYMRLGFRWRRIPEMPGNPVYELAMRNDKKYPCVTWVIAQKL
jgi:hypothetical protein